MKIVRIVIAFILLVASISPLVACSSKDNDNKAYATKLNSELSHVGLLPIKAYSETLSKYTNEYSGENLIVLCNLFNKQMVLHMYGGEVSFANDTENYIAMFVDPQYIASVMEVNELKNITELDEFVRTDSYLTKITRHYEIHCDLSKIDEYVLKISPTQRVLYDYFGDSTITGRFD